MNALRRVITWLRTWSRWPRARPGIPQLHPLQPLRGNGAPNQGRPFQNRLMQALHEIVDPIHKSQDEVRFQPINQDGRFPERGEEFRRDGNARSAHFHRAFVETISGSVVPPDRVRGRCLICQGFEDEAAAFCAFCGKCCCRRCQRRFSQGTIELVLCPRDFLRARDAVNTWILLDQPSGNRANQP